MNSRDESFKQHKISIFIVDDHPMFREGLQQALTLEDDVNVIGYAENGEDALRMVRQLEPEVVVLDINLPLMNGMQVARQLRSDRRKAAIIMLTAYHDEEQVLHAMRTGAAAYCSKDITPDELIKVIRDVHHGKYVVNGERMDERQLDEWIQSSIEAMSGPYIVDADDHFIPLSHREMEILQFVTEGMSNKEIAVKLNISQQTVKNHMTSILKKLNVEDRTQAAVNAIRRGWVRLDSSTSTNNPL
jgi:DNA-binding NarL/FixJ family response regulator